VASTPAQEATINTGIELHDKGQYDEAIAKYQEVLKENADNVTAIYEMAYSYMEKKDYDRSVEAARRGVQYKSELRPMFYEMIAAAFDNKGQPKQAIETYRQAIASEPNSALLYYNMAVTYRDKVKDPVAARQALKQATMVDPGYAPALMLLAQWFDAEGYRTQALLTTSRLMVVDPSLGAYSLWRRTLKDPENPMMAGVQQDADMRRIPVRSQAPKTDEGDFTAMDALIPPSYQEMLDRVEEGTSEIESLVEQVDVLIDALARQAPPKRPSFVDQQYVPFFVALREKGYVQPFVYWASQRAPMAGVRDWLKGNDARVREFKTWAAQYQWPAVPPFSDKR
jgi:Tfp pilus assembly protein PilF